MMPQAINASYRGLLRRLLRLALVLAAAVIVLSGALWAGLRIALMPQTGEWATEIGRGPFTLQVGVPQLVWLATTPTIGARLHGLRLRTRLGQLRLGWVPAGADRPEPVLTVDCEPCRLPLPAALGQTALDVPAAQLALSREITQDNGQHLRGTLLLGAVRPDSTDAVLAARWQARSQGAGWAVTMDWPDAPARDWLALLAPGLPELTVARIDGLIGATAELQLPRGTLQLVPRVSGLAVGGLGTEAWAHARSSCGPHRAHDARGWLARAVLAAEDQRFYEHPGIDLAELQASLAHNQAQGGIRRGASTVTQQLAKLMVAGDERTLSRKLRELLYALEIEQTLGKARILQLYLNMAPWGETAEGQLVCGADAAARHYFGVPAARLTARQSVTLAAMLHNPRREAERWATQGSVSPERLVWIAEQVRGVPGRQRRALVAVLRAEADSGVSEVVSPVLRATPAAAAMGLPDQRVASRP